LFDWNDIGFNHKKETLYNKSTRNQIDGGILLVGPRLPRVERERDLADLQHKYNNL